eukprot:6805443-Pyramimonas_sp.AAC.1
MELSSSWKFPLRGRAVLARLVTASPSAKAGQQKNIRQAGARSGSCSDGAPTAPTSAQSTLALLRRGPRPARDEST